MVINIYSSLRNGTLLLLILSSSGCSDHDMGGLQQEIEKIKNERAGKLRPMPEFKSYQGFSYSGHDLRSPFISEVKGEIEQFDETIGDQKGPFPDLNRNRENLENFPLDSLKYVGGLEVGGTNWAIITSPDNLIHRVQSGNYLGQNFGEIVEISETEIKVTELIKKVDGGWLEREASLSLID